MHWTEGYASDVEYSAEFYKELGPTFLNFTCILNKIEPIAVNRPYTYCELGCGRGLTVSLLAASNPLSHFYAVDFMPAHIAEAQQLANEARLNNLVLLENSFADLAEGKVAHLPLFDFITLHGVYTWVNAENRQHIVNFLARYLKPGGVVFVSYNAMPGWALRLPLQRLLVEHGNLYPNRSDVQIQQAIEFAEEMQSAQASYFTMHPDLETWLQQLSVDKVNDPRYLVHEYMHPHWQPLYHVDVARDMAVAKLDYAGSAELYPAYPALYLTTPQRELINRIPDTVLQETVKDYLLCKSFRKDVFVRGARQMNEARQAQWLQQFGIALLVPRHEIVFPLKLNIGDCSVNDAIYNQVLDALSTRPHTLPELAALPALSQQTLADLAQIAAMLTTSGYASIYFSGSSAAITEPAHRMNRVLAAKTLHSDDYSAFASPLLGNGVIMLIGRRLLYHCITQQPDISDPAAIARQIMAYRSHPLMKDGKALDLVQLTDQVKKLLVEKVPIWRQLGVL